MAKKIMAVDDSATIRQVLSFTLQGAGFEVTEAEDGQDALEKLVSDPPDMLITDLNMPRMDGIQLIKEVRQSSWGKFIPILMLTTESQEAKKQEGKAAGASAWLVKPFKPEQLLAIINVVLL
ncbi:MAG: two-component system response regulator [Desulfuromonas sp.]|nr:MAG: two-component system response regulator [Desulfuromonas sp.]